MANGKNSKNKSVRDILISIVVGACVAFLTVLFEGLVEFLQMYSQQIIAGATSTLTYIARKMG